MQSILSALADEDVAELHFLLLARCIINSFGVGVKFNYKARAKNGKMETGSIEAYSKEAAALLLQKYNIFVTSLEEQKIRGSLFKNIELNKRVSKKTLAIFFRQLSLMLESRVPVVQSLSSLAVQTHKVSFKEAIIDISRFVEEGLPLSEALAQYPLIFDNFYINLIKSGEASGKISESLYYVSDHLEKEAEIIAQLRQAMIYPLLVMSILFLVVAIIINQLVPKIASLIQETGVKPPFLTTVILNFYTFLQQYWWSLIITLFLLVSLVIYYFNTKEGKKNYHILSLKIPFVKEVLKKVFLERFCSNISTLLIAGISINKALKITQDTVNNFVYKEIISDIEQKVSEGERMSQVLIKYPNYFPPFIIQMIKVGEETGKLDKVLIDVVSFYQKEIKRSINLFSILLEPIIIVILGILVTLLSISIFSSLYGAIGTF